MKTQSLILSLLLLCSVALVQGQTIFRQTFDADIPFNGVAGRCDVVVRFVTGTAFTTAPIIVVEGFDPGHILEPENPDGQQGLADFLTSLEPVELDNRIRTSDVVYINWRNGTDFIQRNAFALERAIRWVNTEKQADGINLPNILIGQSMGGVVARYALRDMENRNLDHNVELYISHDAPHLGANVPQGFQHFARHGKDLYVRTGLTAGLVETVQLLRNRMSPRAALTLADQPASRQMLYNYVNANNTIDNTTHNAWQTELNTLGFPAGDGTTPFRQIAISNGAECSATQTFGDGDNLFTFRGRANTRFLGDLAATSVLPIAAHYLGQPGLFFLGIYPGRNDFEVDFSVNAQADGPSNQVYHGSIVYKKKVLWVVPVQTTLTSRTFTSSSTTLPLDHAPGGWYAVPVNLNDAQVQNDFVRYNITANNADRFNFIPTPSALAIGAGVTTPVKADYFVPYPGSNPPPAPRNSPFVNYVTAFDATNVNLNEEHITLEPRSGNWLLAELNGNNGVLANCQFSCNNMTTSIVGPSAMCNTQQYSISNLPPGAVVDWLVSPENIVNPAVNNNILTLTRVNNGFIDISAVVRTNCVTTDPIVKNNVKVGFPPLSGL